MAAGALTVPTMVGGGLLGQVTAYHIDGNELTAIVVGIACSAVFSYGMSGRMCSEVNVRISDLKKRMAEYNYHINRLW